MCVCFTRLIACFYCHSKLIKISLVRASRSSASRSNDLKGVQPCVARCVSLVYVSLVWLGVCLSLSYARDCDVHHVLHSFKLQERPVRRLVSKRRRRASSGGDCCHQEDLRYEASQTQIV